MLPEVFKYKVGKLPKVIFRKLGKEQAWGQFNEGKIEIDERLKGKKLLEISLHEFTHYQHPELSEEEVIIKSRELTEFLWKLHFRRVDNDIEK